MNKKAAFILISIFCGLLARAEDASNPLDVLEPKAPATPTEPTVPKFEEIKENGKTTPAAKTPQSPAPQQNPTPNFNVPPPEIDKDLEESPKTELPKEMSHQNEPVPIMVPPSGTSAETPAETPKAPAPMESEKIVSTPTVGSEPDYGKESKFHRIYKKYNEQPTSEEAWAKARGTGEAKVYQVQKGDTLFDISKTFFADPFYWPKVWSLNHTQILNPHEIKPGMNVNFFPGSMEEAPTLELAEAGKKGATTSTTSTTAETTAETTAQAKEPEVVIPEPKKKREPLLKNIPGSLPRYRMGRGKSELLMEVTKIKMTTNPESLAYYIMDEPIKGIGVITATELNMKTAGDFQYIYVHLDNNSNGKQFVVQKNAGPVNDPAKNGRKGQMVEVQGEIEILDLVNPEKNIYRAIVKKTIEPLEIGAILTPGKIPMFTPTAGEVTSGVGAKIMGGQYDRERVLFAAQSLIFLDRGSSQGLQEGQVLPVYEDINLRNRKTEAITNDRIIGLVKIVHVARDFATAYVAKSTDDILVGDYVGKFTAQAAAPEVEAEPTGNDFEKDFDEKPAPKNNEPTSGSDDKDLEL
ncbi:MAG: LysM peptidoglycan-binding domain-containing protein [Bdellovibrio sp.]